MSNHVNTSRRPAADRAAFTALYRNHRRALLGYASSILCGDVSAAEDAVDDAFADIWRKGEQLDQIANPAGWMRRIVRNKAIDALRKGGGREQAQDDSFFGIYQDSAPDPEQACMLQSEQGWLKSALSILSSDQREVITLCYFDDLSLAQIADTMDCPVNTIKTRLHYARRKLHNWMEADCGVADIVHLANDRVPEPALMG